MPETTRLTRLRTRMLATAYSNTDVFTQHLAFAADQAVAALAQRDPATAEALAQRLQQAAPLNDTEILDAAVEAGIDTSTWPQRRDTMRAYAREAQDLPATSEPSTEARRLWASLYEHYRPVAEALVTHLQGLPPTWREDLFTHGPSPSPSWRPARELPGPETAPYDTSWEDCAACIEAQDQCRYHRGITDGMDYQRALITTALTDHAAMELLQQRHDEQQAGPAQARAGESELLTS